MNCPRCNAPLTDEDLFCRACGEKKPAQNAQPMPDLMSNSMNQQVMNGDINQQPMNDVKIKRTSKFMFFLIPLVLLLMVIVPLLLGFLFIKIYTIDAGYLGYELDFLVPTFYEVTLNEDGYLIQVEDGDLNIGIKLDDVDFDEINDMSAKELENKFLTEFGIETDVSKEEIDDRDFVIIYFEDGDQFKKIYYSELTNDYVVVFEVEWDGNDLDEGLETEEKVIKYIVDYNVNEID